MYVDPTTQANMATLASRGVKFVEPTEGVLACGDIGKGRMADPDVIVKEVLDLLKVKPDYLGKKVLVTAGATVENIDGVRYLSNHSSGKMGLALATHAHERGAEVTLVAAHVSVPIPAYLNVIRVDSTEDMFHAVMSRKEEMDVIIKAAAPADYRPAKPFDSKVKSDTLTLELVKTPDIAQAVGGDKGDTKLVVFAAETDNLIANAKAKLAKKNADMVIANDVTQEGAGFGVDTNIVTVVTKSGEEPLPKMSKEELADQLLDRILRLW